jgi:hypothetical protein
MLMEPIGDISVLFGGGFRCHFERITTFLGLPKQVLLLLKRIGLPQLESLAIGIGDDGILGFLGNV